MCNIILIRFNLPDKEKACIESVEKFTDLKKHTLTVYDNYPLKENLAVVWNRLIEESEDEDICLLNNDTLVEEGWERLFESLKDKECGAVGPVTNKCGGRQKEMPKADRIEDINDLSGFCYCFRKAVWEEVGRFPEDMPFYGQESVFNRKLEDHGYKLKVDRRVFIFHYKGISWDRARKAKEINDNNREYGRMQYYNFTRRLGEVQKLPRKVVILGAGPGNPFPTFRGIDQACSDFGYTHLPMESTYEEIMAHKPEVMIVVQTRYNEDWYKVITKVHNAGVKTALYFMDLRKPYLKSTLSVCGHKDWQWNAPELTMFDKVFICAKGFIEEWKKHYKVPVEWLPQATIQQPTPPEGGDKYKVVHIGSLRGKYHTNRRDIIHAIGGVTNLNFEDRARRAELSKQSYAIYHASDFSLAVSPLVEGYTSDRLYHCMGSGGCTLALDPGGLEHLKDCALWFKTKEELKEHLNTPQEERDKIKKRAFDFIQTHHIYKERIIHILKNL